MSWHHCCRLVSALLHWKWKIQILYFYTTWWSLLLMSLWSLFYADVLQEVVICVFTVSVCVCAQYRRQTTDMQAHTNVVNDGTVISEEVHRQNCCLAENMPSYQRHQWKPYGPNILDLYKKKGNHNTEELTIIKSITSLTPCRQKRRREPNKRTHCLLACTRVCAFACVSPREWLLCFTHTALPNWWIYWNASSEPENLYTSKRKRKNKENLTAGAESAGYRNYCVVFSITHL